MFFIKMFNANKLMFVFIFFIAAQRILMIILGKTPIQNQKLIR